MSKAFVLTALFSIVVATVGEHPCPMAPAAPPAASAEACHQAQDQNSAGDCGFGCQSACQPSVVLASPPAAWGALVPAPLPRRVVAVRVLPLVTRAIDHIPLA